MTCKRCDAQIDGNQNYCGYCGTSIQVKRLEWKFIFEEIQQIFNFEKGILFTIREMTIRPGKAVREFLGGERQRLVKPIFFLFALSVVYTLIIEWFDVVVYTRFEPEMQQLNEIMRLITSNFGYMNIVLCFLLSFWSKLLFRKQIFNLVERFVFFCYTTGIVMFMLTFISLVCIIMKINNDTNNLIGTLTTTIYYIWTMVIFFHGKKFSLLIKALLTMIFSYLTIIIVAMIIAILYIVFTKIF